MNFSTAPGTHAMDAQFGQVEAAAESLRARAQPPSLGIVLGSGLGGLTAHIEGARAIPYAEIPHMAKPSVEGHSGTLISGTLGGLKVCCLSGRAHLYEGHPEADVVFGVRLLAALGARQVLLTNAAGGIADECTPGRLMLITDHLNFTGRTPLLGKNDERRGPRFVDMTTAYDRNLRELMKETARASGLSLAEGVYAGLLGPTYETPAEIRALKVMGADAVGMSTVLETIALRHLGIPVVGVSCITNRAAGLGNGLLSHSEVAEVAGRAGAAFEALVIGFCRGLFEAGAPCHP